MHQYLILLRNNRQYRYLWWGSVVSQLGDWFNLLASAMVALVRPSFLTTSSAALAEASFAACMMRGPDWTTARWKRPLA